MIACTVFSMTIQSHPLVLIIHCFFRTFIIKVSPVSISLHMKDCMYLLLEVWYNIHSMLLSRVHSCYYQLIIHINSTFILEQLRQQCNSPLWHCVFRQPNSAHALLCVLLLLSLAIATDYYPNCIWKFVHMIKNY